MQGTPKSFLEYFSDPNRCDKEAVVAELKRLLSENEDELRFQFVAKQFAAIDSVPFLEIPAQGPLTQLRYSAAIQALEVIEQSNPNSDATHRLVMELRGRLAHLVRRKQRFPLYLLGLLLAFPILGLIGFAVVLAISRVAGMGD